MANEADTCRQFVVPKLYAAGWQDNQIGEQRMFTDGRILVNGREARRGKQKKSDYLLSYKPNYPLAVVEAKAAYLRPGQGLQQAKDYAEVLGLLFAYATNGHGIIEFDFATGIERDLPEFPSPQELWRRYRTAKGLPEALEDKLLVANHASKIARYYQQIAINRTIEAILTGQRRVLLTMATGTGKTVIAFQIAWRLWSGKWNAKGQPGRKPRILFLADRSFLVDDPKDKTFAPFGDARHKIRNGHTSKSREMYFATYQAIAEDENRPGLYRDYAPDFFDLIIIDEAHRGSSRDGSNWREILEYFTGAVQLGMTATPLREDNRDTYQYFGEPIYTYSLKQGILDGFLAPYAVRRVVIDVDVTGFRPYAGQRDDLGREIPDKEYTSREFERKISLQKRTEAVANHITNYLKSTDRYDKTIVFCTDQEHADQMRRALSNANADLVRKDPNYVARVTSDDHDIGKGLLSTFQDVDSQTPVILTTSQLLTTGVDAPTVKNVVLFKHINSMTDFKQIIGRGTRVRAEYGKLFFTILDYTGTATQNFADPAFDGEPVREVVEETDKDGTIIATEDIPVAEFGEGEDADPAASAESAFTYTSDHGAFKTIRERTDPRKLYLTGVDVTIIYETDQQLDANGQRLRTVRYTDFTGEQVRSLYRDSEDLRTQWMLSDQREVIIHALEERGIALEQLTAVLDQPDADPFDLLCHVAFHAPVRTRRERADRVRREQRTFLSRYAPAARSILEVILDQYANYGPKELVLPDILHLPAIEQHGNVTEISTLFGGTQQLLDAVTELQNLLYAA